MADKNVKAELNAEDLEGVAGGAAAEVKTIDVTETSKHLDDWSGVEPRGGSKEKMSQTEDYIKHQVPWKPLDRRDTIKF